MGVTAPDPECEALRLLFQNSPDAVWLCDAESGAFLDCNEAAVALLRARDKAELLQSRPADWTPEVQQDGRCSSEHAATTAQTAQAEGSARFEWMARRLDGELFYLEGVRIRIHRQEGDLHFVVCRDITDRKRAEAGIQKMAHQLELRVQERTIELEQANEQLKTETQRLRRKEKIQKAIYEISQAVLTADDLDSLYQQVHSTVQGLMRSNNFYLALRERGKDVFTFPYFVDEVDPPPKPMTVTTGLTGYVLRTGRPLLVNRQTKIHKKGAGLAVLAEPTGETPYLEAGSPSAVWLGVPLTVRGETIGVMALQDYQDETAYGEEEKQILCFLGEQTALAIERKRAENDLLKALASEKELSQLKSTFVSTVSHEFRTPLGIILSSAQILADYFNQLEPAERNENLLSIQKNARRMADLMEEVLLLSQAEARKLDFKLAALDLASFCRRLTDEVLSSTNRRCPILLSLGLIAGEVQADERLLRHILTNLLTNAVKYSEPGSPVNFSLTRDGCDAVWQIRDHGIGISEADFERLCDPFHRGGNVGSVPGSGLGLTIVKRCVELHKGRIQFESQVGQGTRVTVRLTVFPEVDGSA